MTNPTAILEKISNLETLIGESKFAPYFTEIRTMIDNYVLQHKKEKEQQRDWSSLAKSLIKVYKEAGCEGRKPDTTVLWTASPSVIVERLKSSNLDLRAYSDEQIVEATKKYIDVPVKDRKRILLYFIWKKENGEFKSDLLDYLDSSDVENEAEPNNWLYE